MVDPSPISGLKIKLFMDGADLESMRRAYATKLVSGFTTNPTLMRKAGITDYAAFAKAAIAAIPDLPISFEVFSDEFDEMEREARIIAGWGGRTYVKIPVTNTRGQPSTPLIRKLASEGVALNVTAILTLDQVRDVARALDARAPSIVSVFAGRIADTGVDPVPLMREAVEVLRPNRKAELLWASPRELLNLFHAESVGCHIITATADVIAKVPLIGKDLGQYSLETVQMFHNDAKSAGFKL
jgi:transaldolase